MMLSIHSSLGRRKPLPSIPEDEICDWSEQQQALAAAQQNRKLKSTSSVSSSLFDLLNQERFKNGLPPLELNATLTQFAANHAKQMARRAKVGHSVSCVGDLQANLHSEHVGENVQRGDCIADMHSSTMTAESDSISRQNILSEKFNQVGCAVAKGMDGKLYLCQLFRFH